MDRKNIPVISNENNKIPFAKKIKQFFARRFEPKKLDEIIGKMGTVDYFDVSSVSAFELRVSDKINENPNGTVILLDINDLFIANKALGKERANLDIKEIIDGIKSKFEEHKIEGYEICKMGDEISLFIPNKNKEENKEFIDEISQIKTEHNLTFSLGASDNLEEGFYPSFKKAEEIMHKNKDESKLKKLFSVCGTNIDLIINHLCNVNISKARISVEKLHDVNKTDFFNNYERFINDISIERIIENVTNTDKEKDKLPDSERNFGVLKEKYRLEAFNKFGNDANEILIDKYITAKMYSRSHINGAMSDEYYKKMKLSSTVKDYPMQLTYVNLSGVKEVNDKMGYKKGDEEIEKSIMYIKKGLHLAKIDSDIVMNSYGDIYMVSEIQNDMNNEKLVKHLSRYNGELKILSDIQFESNEEVKQNTPEQRMDTLIEKAKDDIEKSSLLYKINSPEKLESILTGIYKELVKTGMIGTFSSISKNTFEFINEKITNEFKNILYEDNNPKRKKTERIEEREKNTKEIDIIR